MQVERCSFKITRLTDFIADSIAFGAVTAILYHALGRFHMPNDPGHPVQYRLRVFRGMDVPVVVVMGAVRMDVGMRILVAVFIYMDVLVNMFVIVCMFVIIRHNCLRI